MYLCRWKFFSNLWPRKTDNTLLKIEINHIKTEIKDSNTENVLIIEVTPGVDHTFGTLQKCP